MAARVLNKDLDTRLREVEEKLGELMQRLTRLEQQTHQPANGNGDGKLAEMANQLLMLDDRVQKITQTIVAQASRFA